ncbi:SEL1-like repeat protein [Vibrio parahaemolyticus]|uniref:hypothetical protein n=1 Tax=Vibrio parahaemolyticus TaxID=670 RepID=UPI00226ADB3B|nr:hypothetical protein [Vibrio parahaemolyticus]MCX8906000.1 hypothetical protein [Vibrio parahaemolyticus]
MVRHIIVLLTLITTSFASNSSQLTSEIFSEVLNTTAYELHDNLEGLEKEDSCEANYIKGMFYFRGIVFEPDLDLAIKHLTNAGECGNIYAVRQLVSHYFSTLPNSRNALLKWYKTGEALNDPITIGNYAYFLYGEGNYDRAQVISLLKRRLSYTKASLVLPHYTLSRVYEKTDKCKGLYHLQLALENGGVEYVNEYIVRSKGVECTAHTVE